MMAMVLFLFFVLFFLCCVVYCFVFLFYFLFIFLLFLRSLVLCSCESIDAPWRRRRHMTHASEASYYVHASQLMRLGDVGGT